MFLTFSLRDEESPTNSYDTHAVFKTGRNQILREFRGREVCFERIISEKDSFPCFSIKNKFPVAKRVI